MNGSTSNAPDLRFLGKVVLITGAASGIGRATARAFAESGALLILADIDGSNCTNLSDELANQGSMALALDCDVSDDHAVAAVICDALEQFGRLDCAFNCAGIEGDQALLSEMTEAGWDQTMDVNLKGTWLCMKHELLQMRKQASGGVIVNCSSIAGTRGIEGAGAYSASKHGVLGLTRCGALENFRHRIRVNAICPGFVSTPMLDRQLDSNPLVRRRVNRMIEGTPLGRPAAVEEVASVVLWLCSESASFVTGQAIHVDGGSSA